MNRSTRTERANRTNRKAERELTGGRIYGIIGYLAPKGRAARSFDMSFSDILFIVFAAFAVLGGLPLALKTHKEIRGAKIIDLE